MYFTSHNQVDPVPSDIHVLAYTVSQAYIHVHFT